MFALRTFAIAAMSVALPGFAQAPNPNAVAFNATVNEISATTITLRSEDGGAVDTFAVSPKVLILQNKVATLADIKPNDFVASAAVKKDDGKLHSTELRIFPDALQIGRAHV